MGVPRHGGVVEEGGARRVAGVGEEQVFHWTVGFFGFWRTRSIVWGLQTYSCVKGTGC